MSFCVCGGCSAESLRTFSHNWPKLDKWNGHVSFSLQRWTETHVFQTLQLGTNSKPAVASACLRPKQSDLVYFFLGTCQGQNPQWYLFLGCYILLLRDSCLCLTNLSARLHGVVATCGHRSHHHMVSCMPMFTISTPFNWKIVQIGGNFNPTSGQLSWPQLDDSAVSASNSHSILITEVVANQSHTSSTFAKFQVCNSYKGSWVT